MHPCAREKGELLRLSFSLLPFHRSGPSRSNHRPYANLLSASCRGLYTMAHKPFPFRIGHGQFVLWDCRPLEPLDEPWLEGSHSVGIWIISSFYRPRTCCGDHSARICSRKLWRFSLLGSSSRAGFIPACFCYCEVNL